MRERSPGHWQLRAFAGNDSITGKPTQRAKTFTGTEKQAAKELAAFVTEIAAGNVAPNHITLEELLERWLENAETKQRPRTLYENRRKIEARINPALGKIRIDKLDGHMLDRQYRIWMDTGLSASTVHKYHCVISAACHQAVKWGWLDSSPTLRATPPRIERHEMKVPTPKQLSDLVRAADEVDPVLATAIALAALTGARRGELVALRWSDLDLVAGRVNIARSLVVANKEQHEGPTKTHQSRDIALDPIALEVLRRRREVMVKLSADAESALVPDPRVLSYNANGATAANPDTLTHRFAKLCIDMEMPALKALKRSMPEATRTDLAPADRWPFRFHDLRHFSVTTLIAAGVDVRTVADRHGHAKATMTLDRYAHALPERDREAAGVLGSALTL